MSLWETFISHGVYGGPNLYKEWDFILRSVLKIDWDVGILYLKIAGWLQIKMSVERYYFRIQEIKNWSNILSWILMQATVF